MNFPPLTKLYINGRRNLSNITINFNPELNIIVGPNGIGKSTILHLLKDLFSEEAYSFSTINDKKPLTVVCEFKEIKINNETIELFGLTRSLIKYKFPVEEDYISQLLNLAATISFDFKNGAIVNSEKYEFANIFNKMNKNFKIISIGLSSDLTQTNPGYIIIDNEIYATTSLNRQNIVNYFKPNKILYLNIGDPNIYGNEPFVTTYLRELEKKEPVKKEFESFKTEATNVINKVFNSKEQQIKYNSIPQMQAEFYSQDGKNIKELSSGEKQLEKLKIFSKAKEELNPYYVLLDEPEIHLNYGQLSYLTDLITNLKKNGTQVFIATHSTYFIRTSISQFLIYLRFDNNHNPKQVNLLNAPLKKNLLQYPDLFFAEKIIIVESSADAIFYQRTFDIIFKEKYNSGLSSKNIQFIPVGGKSNIKNFVLFLQKHLGIDFVIITDLDFCLEETTYSFMTDNSKSSLRKLIPNTIKLDKKKMIRKFKDLSNKTAESMINLMDRIITTKQITDEYIQEYLNYKKDTEAFSYEPTIINRLKSENVFAIFKNENIWILENFKLEEMVNKDLLEHGKVSIDKLNELYYPENIKQLNDFIPQKAVDELFDLSEYIYKKLFNK